MKPFDGLLILLPLTIHAGNGVCSTAAYMNAVKHLRHCTHAIKGKADAQKIQGIGERIADHIEEFLKTGDVKIFEKMRKQVV